MLPEGARTKDLGLALSAQQPSKPAHAPFYKGAVCRHVPAQLVQRNSACLSQAMACMGSGHQPAGTILHDRLTGHAAPDPGLLVELSSCGALGMLPGLLLQPCALTQLATLWLCTNIVHQ